MTEQTDSYQFSVSSAPASAETVTGLLLAGGRSVRMGHDKACLQWNGVSMWRRQLNLLLEAGVTDVLISTQLDAPWLDGRCRVVADFQPGCGPMSGVISGLREIKTPWLLVLPVDVPLMQVRFLQGLIRQALASGKGIIPAGRSGAEPLVAIYPKAVLPLLEQAFARGDFSMSSIIGEGINRGLLSLLEVRDGDEALFANVNSPEDWSKLKGHPG